MGDSGTGNPANLDLNFGQRPFVYSAPSAFKVLCTPNLSTPAVADGRTALGIALYDGNGGTQTISGLSFSPDFVWLKRRTDNDDHSLQDTVRGAGNNRLRTNTTNGENTQDGQISSFNSDGWTMGSKTNANGKAYVGWAWDAGSSTGTNNDGSLSAQVRANPTTGCSIATYTGTNSGGTVGHGLGAKPGFMIFKTRDTAGDWVIYHSSMTANKALAFTTAIPTTSSNFFNDTEPTSSVFTIGTTLDDTNDYVAYCFAPVEGYSAMSLMTGNGSTELGPFCHCGFRPAMIFMKNISNTGAWQIYDTTRDPYNVTSLMLSPDSSGGEIAGGQLDILSNGFKMRDGGSVYNGSNNDYIWVAFAESPFNYARAR